MFGRIQTLAPLLLWPLAAQAGSINDQLMKLDPEERAHQVCVIKGIDTIRREGKLPKADRLDPPPLKWSDSKYGFFLEEDGYGEEKLQA